jgi:hypothetical protein
MRSVRHWLPAAICVAGVVLIAATGGSTEGWEGGFLLISAGLSVWLLNIFYRLGVRGDTERDDEERARDFFAEHGHWPDEPPPPRPAADDPHRRAGSRVPRHGGRGRR